MDVEISALCDAATNDHGKLNILGTFDTITTKEFPTIHPQCAVAYRVRFSKVEEGPHDFRTTIVDEDGQAIMRPLEGKIDVKVPESSASVNLVLNIHRLKIEKPGRFSIDLAIDGRHETSLPLVVLQR